MTIPHFHSIERGSHRRGLRAEQAVSCSLDEIVIQALEWTAGEESMEQTALLSSLAEEANEHAY